MQRELPVHGQPARLKDAPAELVKMCDDEIDAMRLCIQLSRFTSDYVSRELSIDKGQFSRILSGTAWFPTAKRVRLMELCGNRALVQYEAMKVGMNTSGSEEAQMTELRAELESLKAENAALKGALSAVLGKPQTDLARAA
jgi:hypothetical protein